MLSKVYAVLAAGLLGTYGLGEVMGWELAGPSRTVVPATARQNKGWARSSVFLWHYGYGGGK